MSIAHLAVALLLQASLAAAAAAGPTGEPWSLSLTDGPSDADAALADAPEDDFGLEFNGSARFGEIEGFIQTPSGGEPGTTSQNRPTCDELGLETIEVIDVGLKVRWGAHRFTAGAQLIEYEGQATLSDSLMSQSTVFPAGTELSTDIELSWYRLGYEHVFVFDLDGAGTLELAPAVQGVLLDFKYQVDAPPGLRCDRQYSKAGVRLGAVARWRLNQKLSIEAEAFWGVPIENMVEIDSVELIAAYQLWGGPTNGGAVYAGVAFDWIEYEDEQTIPNHIDVDLGPLFIAGLRATF